MQSTKGINVLSLFDGLSSGQIALERADIKVDNYFASEIDKYAIKVTQHNYPNTIQIGDTTKIKGVNLPKIDLLMGGSPCQGFSFAGKQLNFNDPRSKLFFEFVRLLKETKPKYFLLENVRMKKEYQDVISNHLGVEPICINSSLISAQNRVRYYWTNIQSIEQPNDKGILLKDILEWGFMDKQKSYCLDANYYKGGNLKQYFEKHRRQLVFINNKKTLSFITKKENTLSYKKAISQLKGIDFKSNCLTTSGQNFSNSGSTNLIYSIDNEIGFRALSPIECERLQTVPDNYTSMVSDTQRYKMLGNGWTVDVIAHIFRGLLF